MMGAFARFGHVGRFLWSVACTLAGNVAIAFGVTAFIAPTGIICGGATGLALAIQHVSGLPLALISGAVNAVALVAGAVLIGRPFAAATLVSSAAFPVLLGVFEGVEAISSLSGDQMLSAVMGGVATGVGVGLVIRAGSSTGGVDVPVILVARALRVPTSTAMGVANCLILLIQLPFSDAGQILYGLVNTFVMSMAMDAVMGAGRSTVQLLAVTSHAELLRDSLVEAGFGVTLVDIEFGAAREPGRALLCVLPTQGAAALEQRVLESDPRAFIVVTHGVRARGRGFTYDRYASIDRFEDVARWEREYADSQ